MSNAGGPPQRGGRGRGNDRGRGQGAPRGDRGGRGRGGGDRGGARGGSHMDLPFHPGGPDSGRGGFRGGRAGGGGDRGGRGGRGRGGGFFDQGPPIYSPQGGVPALDAKVTQTENAVAAALVKKPKSIEHPERPGYGTQGRQVQLFANYFELKSIGKGLFRYHVGIAGSKTPGGKKAKQVIRLLLEEHFPQVRRSIVTDYRSTLISHTKILDHDKGPVTFDVRYRGDDEEEYRENAEVYRVTCDYTGDLDPAELLNFLTSSNAAAMFEQKADILQALNIAVGHHPKSNNSIASVGANKHYAISDPLSDKLNLGSGLEALRGYFVSVRAATARLLVNIQVKYVACYQTGPLSQVIHEFSRGGPLEIPSLRKFLMKVRVRVTHIERKGKSGKVIPRMKTIIDLASPQDGRSSPNPPRVSMIGAGPKNVLFFLNAPGQQPQAAPAGPKGKKGKKPAKSGPEPLGVYVSVADFFQKNYNIKVNPEMPVINVGTRDQPSYLPVEVCIVEPGQPAKSKLSPNQTREMLKFAVRSPAQNALSIVNQGTQTVGIGNSSNPTLVDFGIQANPGLITVPSRILAAPNVFYNNQKRITPTAGSWNMKSIKFSRSAKLNKWAWLLIEDQPLNFGSSDDLDDCLKQFKNKLNEIGVQAGDPDAGGRIFVTRKTHEEKINAAIAGIMQRKGGPPSLILTILPYNDTGIYNCVKRACDIRHGVSNVNVLGERFRERKEQYFANVGLKFNLKLGGINQVVGGKELGIISENKTMLLGIDVTHPSPGSTDSAPSVAGMVASIDSQLGQWPAEIRVQREARNEMVDDLSSMLKAHLRRWAKNHKNLYPENIIVYRDGVSEGQYGLVLEKELPQLKKACGELYPASETKKNFPRFSIIIVGKRHHTRFYPTRQEDSDRSNNPVNGTVVDRGVTEARNWDFFLQAHTALKGTARPAHYYTIWDEIFSKLKPSPPQQNTADILEAMTHHMCYLFGRATKAVSICPPAYYADLVCTRARCYLSSAFDPITPDASVVTSGGTGMAFSNDDVAIHPRIADTMFYI
ncbi:ribonuclease H-like domain-containing protein [Aspergillus californicus]